MPYGVVVSGFQGRLNGGVFKCNGGVNAVLIAQEKEAVCGHRVLDAAGGKEAEAVKAGI